MEITAKYGRNPKSTDLLIFVLFDELKYILSRITTKNKTKSKRTITKTSGKKTHAKYTRQAHTTNLKMVKNAKCVHEQQK